MSNLSWLTERPIAHRGFHDMNNLVWENTMSAFSLAADAGGMRGAVLMQTSGFATLSNVIASLLVPYQIPAVLIVSERGTLGEFNIGQALVCRTMRPVLDSLATEHHTVTRIDEFDFILDRSIKQATMTQSPATLILSPLLTGGKVLGGKVP